MDECRLLTDLIVGIDWIRAPTRTTFYRDATTGSPRPTPAPPTATSAAKHFQVHILAAVIVAIME